MRIITSKLMTVIMATEIILQIHCATISQLSPQYAKTRALTVDSSKPALNHSISDSTHRKHRSSKRSAQRGVIQISAKKMNTLAMPNRYSQETNHLNDTLFNETKSHNLVKRDGITIDLHSHRNFYGLELKVGSQKSPNFVLVDTGSSDLWFKKDTSSCDRFLRDVDDTPSRTYYQDRYRYRRCLRYGSFDPELSSSVDLLNEKFFSRYGRGVEYAGGEWAKDDVWFDFSSFYSDEKDDEDEWETHDEDEWKTHDDEYEDCYNAYSIEEDEENTEVQVSDMTFGIANDTHLEFSILGIGFPDGETKNTKYSNFPLRLNELGLIKRAMYSIYLNDDYVEGNGETLVLFGGLDHSKYDGELSLMPAVKKKGTNMHLVQVTLSELNTDFHSPGEDETKVKEESLLEDKLWPAILDTGCTYTHFPDSVLNLLLQGLGVERRFDKKFTPIECDKFDDYTMKFNFQSKVIDIPLKSFIVRHENNDTCSLAIVSSYIESTFLMGIDFLKHVYMTVDIEEKMIGLAQINYDASVYESNVVAVEDGDYGVKVDCYRGKAVYATWIQKRLCGIPSGKEVQLNAISDGCVQRPHVKTVLMILLCFVVLSI
ncbi:unnamed protein product [Ambrosiozyma monospora]|uniref:Unnamed protein product n=1 Tax=Ambrosiozyma monospora TaxID=43982 RepID=A0A9W6YZL4_AMBMO|nr:unnamed protein product [Ambrosiozyma monospora]